jgi:hypothetical protein
MEKICGWLGIAYGESARRNSPVLRDISVYVALMY